MPAIHRFKSTGDAYDRTQCDETIKTGDILVIESEKVVGFAWAWPVAITTAHGAFHTANEGKLLKVLTLDIKTTEVVIKSAAELAKELGFTLNPEMEALLNG